MHNRNRFLTGLVTTAAVALTAAGCDDDFLRVRNPNVVEASTIDPVNDLGTFSLSARQNFATAFGSAALYGAWFTGEAYVGDTFPTRNEFGRRNLDFNNGTLNGEVWQPISLATSTSERVLELSQEANLTTGVNYARAALFAGYSILFQAEYFCEGAVGSGREPGRRMNTSQLLDLAAQRFQTAIQAAGGTTGEAGNIANAARVGLARTHLQAGRNAEALTAANQVPAAFNFNLEFVDDAAQRTRLGNRMWQFTLQRESLVVPPAFRAMNDPRVRWNDAGRVAQDGELRFFRQEKFPAWSSPMRLASGLEARYIAAEAQLKQGNPTPALTLINERRAAGNQGAFVGTGQATLLAELMDQKARDFWLEGHRMGDFRRNRAAVPYVPPSGQPYYKPGQGLVSNDTCFPIPEREVANNPNFKP